MDKVPETRKDQLLREQKELTEKIARDENLKKLSKQETDKQAKIEIFKTTNPGDQAGLNKLFLELKAIRADIKKITGTKEGERPISLSDQIDSLLYMPLDSETLKNTTIEELEKLREQITGYLMPDMATLEQTTALANMLEEISLLIEEKSNPKPAEVVAPPVTPSTKTSPKSEKAGDSKTKKEIEKKRISEIKKELEKPLSEYSKKQLNGHLSICKNLLLWEELKNYPDINVQIMERITTIEEMLGKVKPESPNEKKFTEFTSYETAERMGEKKDFPVDKKFKEFKGINARVYLYKRKDGNYEMHLNRDLYINAAAEGKYLPMFNFDRMKTDTTYMTIKPAIIKLNPDGSFEVLQNGEVKEATPKPNKYVAPTETIKKGEPVPASAPRDASIPETKEGWTPEKEETLNNLLGAIEKSKRRIAELDAMKEALTKTLSMKEIEEEITKQLNPLLKEKDVLLEGIKINTEGNKLKLEIKLKPKAPLGLRVSLGIKATIGIQDGSIKLEEHSYEGMDKVKEKAKIMIDPQIEKLVPELINFLENKYGKKINSIQIKNGKLEVVLGAKK